MPKIPLLLSLIASLAMIPTAQAAPDDVCVRHASGVPGAPVKHPQWWNTSLNANQRDVRWTGATTRGALTSETPELASSRMIWDKPSRTVFFEFSVRGDPSVDTNQDLVMFAVSDTAGTAPELFVQFQALRPCATVANCEGLGTAIPNSAIQYSEATNTGTGIAWSPLSTTNPSSDFVVDHAWVEVEPVAVGSSFTYNWTLKFSMQVPVSTSNDEIRPNLRAYGNAVLYFDTGSSGVAAEYPLLCNPSGLGLGSNDCKVYSADPLATLPDGLPPNMGLWPVLESADPTACDGIELIRDLVGSDHNPVSGFVPGTTVPYVLPGSSIPFAVDSRLLAGFHNATSETLQAGDITAEFRIANWGLQVADWHAATWDHVGDADLSGEVPPGTYCGDNNEAAGSLASDLWNPQAWGFDPTTSHMHQCIHVRLRANRPVPIAVDSVFRNMNVVNASVFRGPASIDTRGLKLPKGKRKHEIYLLVDAKDMPSNAACKAAKGKLYGCAKGGKLYLGHKALTKQQKRALNREFDAGRTSLTRAELDALLKHKKRKGKKAGELPYYAVHGMVATGRVINLPDAPQTPVIDEFSSYGYEVEHEGEPSQGWEFYMHGASPVGKSANLFKMHVKPNTVASVANTVRVLSKKETKACTTPPKPRWAAYSSGKRAAIDAEVIEVIGKGKAKDVSSVRVKDDQLGCSAPPLRLPCKAKDCQAFSPAVFIQSNRYVGDFSKAVAKPTGKLGKRGTKLRMGGKRPGVKPSAKKPSTKKPSTKKPSAKKPSAKPSAKKPSTRKPRARGPATRGSK